jgi:hypothetical protein
MRVTVGPPGIQVPEFRARAGVNARARAMERLAMRYPNVFRVLVDEERVKRGLPPLDEIVVGRPPASDRVKDLPEVRR